MKELLARFRFGDFSAYFLPGLVMVGAVVAALSLAKVVEITALRGIGLAETAAIACAAYVCGAVISGSSYRLIAPVYFVTRWRRYADPRFSVQPKELADAVETALADVLGTRLTPHWSEDHFYLARTAVHEKLPQTSAEAMRQNDLMRLRENMLIPLLTWCCIGVVYWYLRYRQQPLMAFEFVFVTLVLVYIIAGRIACRSVDNRGREVREICVGFLIGHRLGLFRPGPLDTAPSPLSESPQPMTEVRPDLAKLPVSGPVAGST